MVSSYRLIPNVISASFTQQNDATSWCGCVVFLPWCRNYNQSIPTTQFLSLFHHNDRKILLGAEVYPSCSVTCMSLNYGNAGMRKLTCRFNWPGTRMELVRTIAECRVVRKPCGGGSDPAGGTAVWHQMCGCSHATTCLNIIYLQ